MIMVKIKKNKQKYAQFAVSSEIINDEELKATIETVKHLLEKSFIDTLKPYENAYELKQLFPEHLKIKIKQLDEQDEIIINV